MLATDRCFWTCPSLPRMFLLGDEPLFFSLTTNADGYKASRLLKWSLWKQSSKQLAGLLRPEVMQGLTEGEAENYIGTGCIHLQCHRYEAHSYWRLHHG